MIKYYHDAGSQFITKINIKDLQYFIYLWTYNKDLYINSL